VAVWSFCMSAAVLRSNPRMHLSVLGCGAPRVWCVIVISKLLLMQTMLRRMVNSPWTGTTSATTSSYPITSDASPVPLRALGSIVEIAVHVFAHVHIKYSVQLASYKRSLQCALGPLEHSFKLWFNGAASKAARLCMCPTSITCHQNPRGFLNLPNPSYPQPVPGNTCTLSMGAGIWRVWVQVALNYPRVTHATAYASSICA